MSTDEPAAGAGRAPALLDPDGHPLRFEAALEELEALVERMEGGELSLEESVTCFERGVRLHRYCQDVLEAANQKVEVLMRRSESAREEDLAPFEDLGTDDEG